MYMPAHETSPSQSNSFRVALTSTEVEDRDLATVELARSYAALLDEAAPKATYDDALRMLRPVVASAENPEIARAFRKIETALSAHSVASDLGPKYLAALLALGMAPSARGVKGGTTNDEQPSPLDELDERRRTREHRAANLDAATS